MENKSLTIAQRNVLESFHTDRRIVELLLRPVKGNFDSAHLREINRRIFQDLPAQGFVDVTPGEYRPPVPPNQDWMKMRTYDSLNGNFHVAYSSMDEASQARLDRVLESVKLEELRELSTDEFTSTISTLYAELDYIHPFREGNSRTLRAFTNQIAEEAGFELDWSRFNLSPEGRDMLYIARDLSVNELAAPHVQNENTMRKILQTHQQLKGHFSLPYLLRDVISPNRALEMPKNRMLEINGIQVTNQEKENDYKKPHANELIKDKLSDVNTYLAQPHIEKMVQLFVEHNLIENNLSKDEVIQNFKMGLASLYQQGKEISPVQVQKYEDELQKSVELER